MVPQIGQCVKVRWVVNSGHENMDGKMKGMSSSLKFNSTIWVLFFLIAVGLGYPSLKWYTPSTTEFLDDSTVYASLLQNGLDAVNSDHRSTRLLVPFMARPIYSLVDGNVGSWNSIQFSMLMVGAFFCAFIAVYLVQISEIIKCPKIIGVLAGFIFMTNFTVPNLYLAGLVDVAECFFVLVLLFALYEKKWGYLPVIAFFATLAKETFLPIGISISLSWWCYESFKDKKVNVKSLLWVVLAGFVSVSILISLKSFALNQVTMPWEFAKNIESSYELTIGRALTEVRHFSYAFVWLLPLALFRINTLPPKWVISSISAIASLLVLGCWAGVSGAAMSRYLFNVSGPLLSISAAIFIHDISRDTNSHTIDRS